MKILTLLRHAKSAWDDPVGPDFDRPLNRRGRRAAWTVGREMKALNLDFDAVRASPAQRVVETIADVARGYGRPLEAHYDRRLYLAPAADLLDLIHEIDDDADRLLVIGHNPGLERLALLLTGDEGERDLKREVAIKYPTATIAEIAFEVERWRDVAPGKGRLRRFIRPRDLDPELGPDPE